MGTHGVALSHGAGAESGLRAARQTVIRVRRLPTTQREADFRP